MSSTNYESVARVRIEEPGCDWRRGKWREQGAANSDPGDVQHGGRRFQEAVHAWLGRRALQSCPDGLGRARCACTRGGAGSRGRWTQRAVKDDNIGVEAIRGR